MKWKELSGELITVFYPVMRICDTIPQSFFYCLNVQCFKQTDKIILTLWLDSIDGLLQALMNVNEITVIVSGQLVWHVFNLKDPL